MSQSGENQSKPQSPEEEKQQQQKEQDTFEYIQPIKQQYQYEIFINDCNSYIGSQLVQTFRNDHEIEVNPNLIVSNIDPNISYQGQTEVSSIIDIKNRRLLNSVLHKSDIILFVLSKETIEDFYYVTKILGKIKKEKKKKFICISSLLSWNGRRSSIPANSKITIDNLDKRNSTRYNLIQLENICLDLNNSSNCIQSYVISAGLIYGNGQNQLFSYFKRALEQNQKLKVYGTGNNKIPMIHVKDLAQMTQQICFKGCVGNGNGKKLPRSNYYFGVDCSNVTQEQIIKCIAETVGNGGYENIPLEDTFLQTNYQLFTLDMQIQNIPDLSNWHSKQGFINNIGSIVSQFNSYRGLKPNKIVVSGPPASGRTKICQILSNSYGLPIIDIKKLVQQIKEEESQYAQALKVKIEELRIQRIDEERKAFEQAKKKKKGKGNQQFDADKVTARLPDQDLIQLFKRRLNKSDCLNKGYILDGWPKSAKLCEQLFLNQNKQIIENIFPNSVFFIEANEEQVKQRIKNIPTEAKEGTHLNEQATIRRFQAYTQYNNDGTVPSFFQGKADIKNVQFNYQGADQFVQFVQRNGPLGFKKKQQQKKAQESEEKIQQEEGEEKKEKVEMDQQDEDKSQQYVEQVGQESNEQLNLEKLTEHEKNILNQKSRPIRQYLIDNVIPQITEGLLQICKDAPRDPIQFLIRFLETKERIKKSKQNQ